MRRFVLLAVLLLVVGISVPAGAVSEQFYEVPFSYTGYFPNPCTGEDVETTFEGTIYVHEVIKGDRVHENQQWRLEAYTEEGYTASLKNIGADTYNYYDDDHFVMTLKGNYQFRHENGGKYRAHGITHVTEIGGEVIVEFESFGFFCVGK
jgi:hypothetical protein